jgi:hypothetical protein
MNKYLFNNLELYKYSFLSKVYYNLNPQLKLDNNYMIEVFEKACENSNIDFCICLNNSNIHIQNYLTNNDNCHNIILNMSKFSDLETIKWFYELKSQFININNNQYLINSCVNPDYQVLRWLIKFNIGINEQVNQYIFDKSLKRHDLITMRLIYESNPNLDLRIIDGFYLHNPNSLNIYSTNKIFEWLKNISLEQMFTLKYNLNFELILIDNLIDRTKPNYNNQENNYNNQENNYNNQENNYNNQENNYNNQEKNYNECPLCLNSETKIISNCSHEFCSYCIRIWVKKKKSCPICRKSDEIEFFYLSKNI